MARLLLLHGADVFAHFSVDGWTALHSACHGGHDHIAKLLLEEVPGWMRKKDGDGSNHFCQRCPKKVKIP